jgi:hypothetical protein
MPDQNQSTKPMPTRPANEPPMPHRFAMLERAANEYTWYPRQCAICGVQWNRPGPEPAALAPHIHADSDWQTYWTSVGHDWTTLGAGSKWAEVSGVTYPTLPEIPPEVPLS